MSFHDYNKKGFFIVLIPQKIETEYEETRCSNIECKNSKAEVKDDFKFCPLCGSKIGWTSVTDTEIDSFSNYTEEEIPECDNDGLYDWFYSPEFIGDIITEDWNEYVLPKEAEIILCNRNIGANTPDKRETFLNHPATKFLLEKMKCKYEVHFGLVNYSA